MRPHTLEPGEGWQLGSGPFLFAGKPPLLAGEIELINTSDDPLRVRAIRTSDPPKRRPRMPTPLPEVRLSAPRIAPGAGQRAVGQMLVDPATPPGRYEAVLQCGEQRERTILHVFARREVHVDPEPIELHGHAGEALSHPVIVTNSGNVTYDLPAAEPLFLEERDWAGRALVFALRETGEDEGHQQYLDRLTQEFRASLVNPVTVELTSKTRKLAPSDVLEVTVSLTLPERLVRRRQYFGSLPFMDTSLSFEITCIGDNRSGQRSAR